VHLRGDPTGHSAADCQRFGPAASAPRGRETAWKRPDQIQALRGRDAHQAKA